MYIFLTKIASVDYKSIYSGVLALHLGDPIPNNLPFSIIGDLHISDFQRLLYFEDEAMNALLSRNDIQPPYAWITDSVRVTKLTLIYFS